MLIHPISRPVSSPEGFLAHLQNNFDYGDYGWGGFGGGAICCLDFSPPYLASYFALLSKAARTPTIPPAGGY